MSVKDTICSAPLRPTSNPQTQGFPTFIDLTTVEDPPTMPPTQSHHASAPQKIHHHGPSMADLVPVQGEHITAHFKRCSLHDHERMRRCSGRVRKGGKCAHKAIGPSVPGMMPTCKVHSDQAKISTWCRATLPCGFECRRVFEWQPYGFQLCPEHCNLEKSCYFLKIPTELRLRIYQYLLPASTIRTKLLYWMHNKVTDDERLYTNILLVNRQIHDESVGILYGTRLFELEFDGRMLSMCKLLSEPSQNGFSNYTTGRHALQDYQMQMMLLEQQSKRRVQTSTGAWSAGPVEPIWLPPISQRHFNLIQSFRIKILFAFPAHMGSTVEDQKAVELKLYDYTDHLHRLVGRLRLIEKPILRLEVAINFGQSPFLDRGTAFSSAQILLRPFQRLRNITKPLVPRIMMTDHNNIDVELLPTSNTLAADKNFIKYVESWFWDLSSDEWIVEDPPLFDAYWKLKKLIFNIKEHCLNQPKIEEFADLLHAARVVREDDNLPQFREIWDRVVNIWFDYLSYEKQFQSGVSSSIDAIYGVVSNGSRQSHTLE